MCCETGVNRMHILANISVGNHVCPAHQFAELNRRSKAHLRLSSATVVIEAARQKQVVNRL